MTDQDKERVRMAGAGLAGFALVVGAGGVFLVFSLGGFPKRSTLSAVPPASSESALAIPAHTTKSAVAGVPMGEVPASESSPAPILLEVVSQAPAPSNLPASAAAAAAPAASAVASRRLAVSQHLESGSSAHSSASIPVSAPAPRTDKPVNRVFAAPKLDPSKTQSAVAARVHYSVTDRSELMGRAVGPVYNFAGKNAGTGRPDRVAADAAEQVDAAQEEIDASPLSEHDKSVLTGQLKEARKAVMAEPSSN